MDEKKHSRLEVFETLFKEFYKLAMSMDAVRCFKKECHEMDEVILQNPVNFLGHLHLKPEEVMPFIEAEMQKKQERARQLADSIKSLLDEGNYEQWNLLADGLTVADFTDKDIPATFVREPGGLTEQFRKELKETKESIERGDYKEPAGLGPVRTLTVVGDKIVENVDGQTVERIRIVFPDTSEAEKEFIEKIVMKHSVGLLSDQLRARDMAKHLHKEWMTLYGSTYGERYTDVYVIPKKDEPIEVAFIAL